MYSHECHQNSKNSSVACVIQSREEGIINHFLSSPRPCAGSVEGVSVNVVRLGTREQLLSAAHLPGTGSDPGRHSCQL